MQHRVVDPGIVGLKRCYVSAGSRKAPMCEAMRIAGVGLHPGTIVDILLDGLPVTDVGHLRVDRQGLLVDIPEFPAPFAPKRGAGFSIAIADATSGGQLVHATSHVVRLGVRMKPKTAAISEAVGFKGSGFTAPAPVFAHYVYQGVHERSVLMCAEPDACGRWSATEPQIPIDDPEPGLWTVQFDQRATYVDADRETIDSVFVRVEVEVGFAPGEDGSAIGDVAKNPSRYAIDRGDTHLDLW